MTRRHLTLVSVPPRLRVARTLATNLERGIRRCAVCGEWEHAKQPHEHPLEAR